MCAQPTLPQCLGMDTLLPLAGKGASARAARGARRTASGSLLLPRHGKRCDSALAADVVRPVVSIGPPPFSAQGAQLGTTAAHRVARQTR